MADFISYDEFKNKSQEEQAELLGQIIDSFGMKQIIAEWKISKEEYHNLVDDLNIVVRRGRKRRTDLNKTVKAERKARGKKAAANPQLPEETQSAKLYFNLEGEYKGAELSPILTGLSRMVENESMQLKVTVTIERK